MAAPTAAERRAPALPRPRLERPPDPHAPRAPRVPPPPPPYVFPSSYFLRPLTRSHFSLLALPSSALPVLLCPHPFSLPVVLFAPHLDLRPSLSPSGAHSSSCLRARLGFFSVRSGLGPPGSAMMMPGLGFPLALLPACWEAAGKRAQGCGQSWREHSLSPNCDKEGWSEDLGA